MHAMIEYAEAKRIREHLRYYAHDGREDGSCSGCDYTERYPVMVWWHEEKPFHDQQRFLVFAIDETGIPPLYVVATDDGDDYGGHSYTDVLRREVDYFIKHASKPQPDDLGSKTLAIYIDQELSYEITYISKRKPDCQSQPKHAPDVSSASQSQGEPGQSDRVCEGNTDREGYRDAPGTGDTRRNSE